MRKRFVRLSVVAAAVLALLASGTTPAPATLVAREVMLVGELILAAPLGYPCTGTKTTPATPKCPPTVPTVHSDLPLPAVEALGAVPSVHVHVAGNTIPIVNFEDDACLDMGENVGKAPKAPAHAGSCTFADLLSPKNHMTGYCGLNGGQVVVTFTDALGQAWTLDIHFTWIAGKMVLTGHARNVSTGRTYLLAGYVDIVAVPEPLPTPTVPPPHFDNNSCLNKTARWFTFSATVGWGGLN